MNKFMILDIRDLSKQNAKIEKKYEIVRKIIFFLCMKKSCYLCKPKTMA